MKSNLILLSILLFFSTTHSMKRDPNNHSKKRVVKKQIYNCGQQKSDKYIISDDSVNMQSKSDNEKEFSYFADLPNELKLMIFLDCILANIDKVFDNSRFEELEDETHLISELGISKFKFLKKAILICNQNIQNCIIALTNLDIDFKGYFHQNFKKKATQYFKNQFVKKLKACISNKHIYRVLEHSTGGQQISTRTMKDPTENDKFIVEVLLLARNNANRPQDQDIKLLKCLFNWAMKHQILAIIPLLIEKETLEDQNPNNQFLNLKNFYCLFRDSENENIIKTLLAQNHLRNELVEGINKIFYDSYANYAKESFDPIILYCKIAPNIASLLLDFFPIDTKFSNGNYSLLMMALYLNDKAMVKKLLNSSIDFKTLNDYKQTALNFVEFLDEEDAIAVAQEIISKEEFKASHIDKQDKFGLTPIDYAYLNGYYKLANVLINIVSSDIAKPSMSEKYSVSNLTLLAASRNSLKLLKSIIKASSVYVNVFSTSGQTPLMLVANNMYGNLELIILLLSEGADITVFDKKYNSTLSYLFKYINNKIKKFTQNSNDKKNLLLLKDILLKRLDEVKNTNFINPIERITDFQEFLEENIN